MRKLSFKVYGEEGHRFKGSFDESVVMDFSKGNDVRIIEIENSDKTGTNDYSIVRITRNSARECVDEFFTQMSDGFYEGSKIGKYELITDNIKLINFYDSVENDYCGSMVSIDKMIESEANSTRDAIVYAFGEELADDILDKITIEDGIMEEY